MTSLALEKDFVKKVSPAFVFWLVAGLHLLLWTLVPTLTSHNAPLDVIEGYAWGREWLIGTYKHPPMQAWILEIMAVLTNRAEWAHFLASQIAIVTAFWAIWRTGLRLTDEITALTGVLLLEGVVYYNFTSPEFNPNVLQLPFWALACLSFHRAVKESHWYDWVLLGIWAAAGLYTKYSMALILFVLSALMVWQPEARRRFSEVGPYLSLLIFLLLFVPHLHWLIKNDFLPFKYAGERAGGTSHFYQRFTQPFMFMLAQQLALAAIGVMFVAFTRGKITWADNIKTEATTFDRVFLHAVALGPFLIIIAISIIIGFRPRDMWGSCLWNFIGLWLMAFVAGHTDKNALGRFIVSWLVIFLLGLMVLITSNFLYPYIKGKPQRINFPGQKLSEAVTQAWYARFQEPLVYVIGDTWLAGNVSYYAPKVPASLRPHVVIVPERETSPRNIPQEVWRRGGILLWGCRICEKNIAYYKIPPYLYSLFPEAEIQQPLNIPWCTSASIKPLFVGWAILPPTLK